MRFLIVGLGSAGQRHARVIRKNLSFSKIDIYRGHHFMGLISQDLSRIDKDTDPADFYELNVIKSIKDLQDRYDLIVIATPPNSHFKYLELLKQKSKKFIIEKPISNRNENFAKYRKKIVKDKLEILVGYQHFYNPVFNYVGKSIPHKTVVDSIYMKFAEPLSQMNPFRDMSQHHLNSISGGGALLALSHEIDFCLRLFPQLQNSLTVKFDFDPSPPFIRHSCCVKSLDSHKLSPKVNIDLSFFEGIKSERYGLITGENFSFLWDLNKKFVEFNCGSKKYIKQFKFNSDSLIWKQLKDFLINGIEKEDLLDRFDRAVNITRIC